MEHKRGNFHAGPRSGVKPKEHTANAPQVKHGRALEAVDGSGQQVSEHPNKNQSKVMRFLRH